MVWLQWFCGLQWFRGIKWDLGTERIRWFKRHEWHEWIKQFHWLFRIETLWFKRLGFTVWFTVRFAKWQQTFGFRFLGSKL